MNDTSPTTKHWVIIATEWGGDALHGQFIPPENRPTIFQSSREEAEAELLRLEQRHHKGFQLFEAVAFALRVGGPQRISDPDDTPSAYVVETIE